jgi:hypothetical protein
VVFKNRSSSEFKYIANIFARTGLAAVAWFGLSGLALQALSDRVSLNCERSEESVPECKLSVKKLFNEYTIDLPSEEIKHVNTQGIYNPYLPDFFQWQMAIVTNGDRVYFTSYSIGKDNNWEDFRDRTNRFLYTPQLRTFNITSEYNFWFKFISQFVSGISILAGLFIMPGLYLTAKYGSDTIAQQQAIDGFTRQFTRGKSSTPASQESN